MQLALAFILSLMLSLVVGPPAQLFGSAGQLTGQTLSSFGGWVNQSAATSETTASPGLAAPAPSTSSTTAANSSVQASGLAPADVIATLFAFVGGVSISAGFTQILRFLQRLPARFRFNASNPFREQARLTQLEGIDIWTEARLAEEGVENIHALAHAPLQRLVLRTHFTTDRIVDWVDEALLYIRTYTWPFEPAAATDIGAAPMQLPSRHRSVCSKRCAGQAS